MNKYDWKKFSKISTIIGECIGALSAYQFINENNYKDYIYDYKYTQELIDKLRNIELYDYDIQDYLEYQELIKKIRNEYIYIGEYPFDDNTQFLWNRIYLSNEEEIKFNSHRELIDYINKNFVKK